MTQHPYPRRASTCYCDAAAAPATGIFRRHPPRPAQVIDDGPRRLRPRLRLLWPYVVLWLAVAGAIGGYAWYEIASSRERELAAGRIEAENLARVLQEQVARSLETFDRTLALLKIVHEKAHGAIALVGA